MMATDMDLVLIGNRPPSRQDMPPSSSSRPPTRHESRPPSRASNRHTTNPDIVSDHEMKLDDPGLHSTNHQANDVQPLSGGFFPAQDTFRSDLDDLREEPSPSRTGIWVARNASYEDELFTGIPSQHDWSVTRPMEEPEKKSLRQNGELDAKESEQIRNTNRLVEDDGLFMKDIIGPTQLTDETPFAALETTEHLSSAASHNTFKEIEPISSAEPQHSTTGVKILKRDGQNNGSSKPISVGKSQSGKYLFRPLTSARVASRKDVDAANIEKGIDKMIEKQMTTMFGKTFKKKIDNYVIGDNRFSGDVSGKTAILTDRPPSGRTINQSARTGTNSRGLEALERNEDMNNLKQTHLDNKGKKFNYVEPYDVSSRQDRVDMGRQQLMSDFEEDRAGSVTPSARGYYGEQSGRTTPSNTHRPNSVRPFSAKQRSRYRHTPSFVDETLFGDPLDCDVDFPSPFEKTPISGRMRPIIFDCTDYRAKAEKENKDRNQRSRPQSRSGSVQINTMKQRSNSVDQQSRPSSSLANETMSRTKKTVNVRPTVGSNAKRHSYVDESLFGDPLEEAGWAAPWDKNKPRPRPLIFDATDYRRKDVKMVAAGEKLIKGSSIKRSDSARNLAVWR